MNWVTKLYMVTLALMLGGGSIAAADDLLPPAWRGGEGSTHQAWEFDTSETLIQTTNPYGPVILSVDTSNSWMETYGQQSGIWPLGEIDIEIANKDGGDEKNIWIQLTWKSAMGITSITPKQGVPYQPNIGVATEPYYESLKISRVRDLDLGDGWTHSVFQVDIWPNPSVEWLTIKGNILVDELVVDTICPEPATMALLGIGGLLFVRRKKRCQ